VSAEISEAVKCGAPSFCGQDEVVSSRSKTVAVTVVLVN